MRRAAAIEALFVTGGRIAFVGFWFVAVLLIYRGLGKSPEGLAQAGFFALSIACVKTASGFISDPIDLAIMRRVPPLLASAPARAWDILRASACLRFGGAVVVAGALAALAPLAGRVLPDWASAAPYLRIAALAIVGDSLLRALLVLMQASERFFVFLALEGAVSVLRFLAIVGLWVAGAMEVELVLAVYAAASTLVAMVGIATLVPRRHALGRAHWADVTDVAHYLKWMVPAMLLAAVNERLDVFLVYSFTGAGFAGLYGAALALALIPDILGGCLSTLIQPRIMKLHASGDYGLRLRQFLVVSVPACAVVFGLSLLLARPVFGLVLGSRYVEALPAFHWLLAGTLVWLAVTPLPMTLVAVAAPKRIVFVTAVQSLVVVAGGLLLVPRYGWVGMAQAVFAMRATIALLLLVSARGIASLAPIEVEPSLPAGALQP